jgi:hypothetical protein
MSTKRLLKPIRLNAVVMQKIAMTSNVKMSQIFSSETSVL